ncbi:hypothetical protein HOY34_19200 [Xinfangfangia sp. D13-10-4-6]|uniref:hypothetical protein n=1 Tax=Pseudogemmobacter hezensis TaxID=2737662 RepID=UPI001C12F881|nr:hypothetical protein [Pseudogemmobacter hezensis]NPD17316.1 hypothetical protein [Pseudogemmobacter hezensis]
MMKIDLHSLARAFGGLPEGQHLGTRLHMKDHVPAEALQVVAFAERQEHLNAVMIRAQKPLAGHVNVII